MEPGCKWTYVLVLSTTRFTLNSPRKFEATAMPIAVPLGGVVFPWKGSTNRHRRRNTVAQEFVPFVLLQTVDGRVQHNRFAIA